MNEKNEKSNSFLDALGDETEDPDEEHFILFSSKPGNHDLGFVDRKSSELSIDIGNRSFSILQSPTLLSSKRQAGTTGAVLWKVTPLLCKWLTHPKNPLRSLSIISNDTTVLELGSGVSGLLGLTLGPLVHKFIASDQEYCMKLLNKNLIENLAGKNNNNGSSARQTKTKAAKGGYGGFKSTKSAVSSDEQVTNITAIALDWEADLVDQHPALRNEKIDVVFACDCIYNESLIPPFVDTLASVCKLQLGNNSRVQSKPTLAVIAQELRSPDVLQAFLTAFHDKFHIWRIPDEMFKDMDADNLMEGGGYCVHVGILRDNELIRQK